MNVHAAPRWTGRGVGGGGLGHGLKEESLYPSQKTRSHEAIRRCCSGEKREKGDRREGRLVTSPRLLPRIQHPRGPQQYQRYRLPSQLCSCELNAVIHMGTLQVAGAMEAQQREVQPRRGHTEWVPGAEHPGGFRKKEEAERQGSFPTGCRWSDGCEVT